MTESPRNVAVLVGNGLSIAFNPELNLRAITTEMLERIQAESSEGSSVVAAMKEIAQRALPDGATNDDDFEKLVGAFAAESRTLGYLEELAALVSPQDAALEAAFGLVRTFAEMIRDRGLSHVLEVICDRSYADWDRAAGLHALVLAVTSAFAGNVAFGNLNYDTLLLAALVTVCPTQLADMASGWRKLRLLDGSGTESEVPQLRVRASDFPTDRRVQLLHLHGSVTFWTDPAKSLFAKLSIDYLRDHEQWRSVRDNTTNIRPAVVLATQRDKSDHVKEPPFAVAYEVFRHRLELADHWLIIGYSFRDVPVNEMLRTVFGELAKKPKILLVTYGATPTIQEIELALGWCPEGGDSSTWLTVNRDGANGVEESAEWAAFTV